MAELIGGHEPVIIGRAGWIILGTSVVGSIGAGWLAARIVGFSFYPGWQGAFVQQPGFQHPDSRVWWAILAAALTMAVCFRIGQTVAGGIHPRVGAAIGALGLVGFSLRGGTMGSVMQAADGKEIFWALAAELLVMGLVVAVIFVVGRRLSEKHKPARPDPAERTAAVVQVLIFAALILLMGKSYEKGQGMLIVLASGILATMGAETVTGRVWRHGWCIPLALGVIGYALNAVYGQGIETAALHNFGSGFAMSLPLDYASMGPAGIVLGELILHKRIEDQMAAKGNAGALAA